MECPWSVRELLTLTDLNEARVIPNVSRSLGFNRGFEAAKPEKPNRVDGMLPSGTPVKKGIDVAVVDFAALLRELKAKKFSGYLAICVAGKTGVEEGTVVFDTGKFVAAFYEYLAHEKILVGPPAVPRIVNAAAAQHGVVDIYQLTSEQVQMILAFNEKAVVVPAEKDLVVPAKFSAALEEEALEGMEGKGELLKKYKVGEAEAGEKAPSLPEPAAEKEGAEDVLERLAKTRKGGQ